MIARTRQNLVSGLSPDEAAAQWLIRIDDGLNEDGQAEFERWKAASSAHAAAFARAEAAWDVFDDAGDDPALEALRASALATGREPRRGLWVGLGTAIAASLMFAVALGTGVLSMRGNDDAAQIIDAGNEAALAAAGATASGEFVTARGEKRTIDLADGSKLTLNTDSAIRVDFNEQNRLIHLLRGQALFEVAKDPHHPFVVQAGDRQVTALGTIFEVRLDADRMKVTLVEGKVVVDEVHERPGRDWPPMIPAVLEPGQELVAIEGIEPALARVNVEQQLSWLDGFVEFEDVPLAEAVAEMNRYSARPMVIRDSATGRLRVSGLFRTGDPERFAAIVSELLPIRQRTLPNGSVQLSIEN